MIHGQLDITEYVMSNFNYSKTCISEFKNRCISTDSQLVSHWMLNLHMASELGTHPRVMLSLASNAPSHTI